MPNYGMQNSGEWKAAAVLIAFMIYSLAVLFNLLAFTFSGFTIFLSFIILVAGFNTDTKMKTATSLIIVCIWLIIAFIAAITGFNGWVYYFLFSSSIAIHLNLKDAILLIGITALSIFTIQQTFMGFVILLTFFAFIYATSKSYVAGIVMWVPLLLLGLFIGSGWADITQQKISSISTQLGETTGISTEGIGSGINAALNNTWLLLTNPNAWYEKQFVMQGNRDEGLTSQALEITKIEALPSTVMPLDTFDIMFELENKGTKPAENVKVGAKADSLADNCGRVGGKFCNPACILIDDGAGGSKLDSSRLSELVDGCPANRDLGTIAPLEKRFESVGFAAPECPGTYTASAAVFYDYVVDATLNLQMISRPYYQELLQNNKMKWITEMSTASAGPFKLTLRTDRDQPIPDTEADQNIPQKFKIYLGLVNEHQGRASIKEHATLKIPKELMLVGWDAAAGKYDNGSCSITYDIKIDASNQPAENGLTLAQAVGSRGLNNNEAEYKKLEQIYRDAAKKAAENEKSPFITYQTVDIDNRKMEQNSWRYYKCGFSLEPGNKISQIQTLMMRATLPYTFEYEKSTSVSVRSTASDPPKCKDKTLKVIGAIEEAQPLPQTKDAILNALAQQIYYCYNKQAIEIFKGDRDCGNFKIDIAGCGGITITAQDIFDKLEKNSPPLADKYTKVLDDVPVFFTNYKAITLFWLFKNVITKDWIDATHAGGTVVFDDGHIYKINIYYHVPFLGLSTRPDINIDVKYTTEPIADPLCSKT